MTSNEYKRARMQRARARAKVAELSATSYRTPATELDIDKLHYACIAAISRYVDAVDKGASTERHLKNLQFAAEFYDAASAHEEYLNDNDGFWIFALTAYFLMGNYGSARACLNKIKEPDYYGHEAARLYQYMCDILRPDNNARRILSSTDIQQSTLEDEFFQRIRKAVEIQVNEYSSVNQLSRYTEISATKWREELASDHITQLLWPAQEAIAEQGILRGNSGFIQMPTGAGKTKSIELLLRARILAGRCRLAIYVAPMTALCDEVSDNLTEHLSDIARVSKIPDVRVPASTTFVDADQANVMVMTPEKLAYALRHTRSALSNVDLIVFDEAHLLGDHSRGPKFETLLVELLEILPPTKTQWILISAVVSNAQDIAEWALSDPSRVVYRETHDTIRSYGLIDTRANTITYYSDPAYQEEDYSLKFDTRFQLLKRRRQNSEHYYPDLRSNSDYIVHDTALYHANALAHRGSVAVFFPRPDSIRKTFKRFSHLIDSDISFAALSENCDAEECNKIANLTVKHYGPRSEFIQGIRVGILPHYGNLPTTIRCSVEEAIRNKFASTVICTSTLSQGVNLPLKYVIVTSFSIDRKLLEARDFHNLIGRAGRPGYYTEGSALVLKTPQNVAALKTITSSQDGALRCESALLHILFREDAEEFSATQSYDPNSVVDLISTHYTSGDVKEKLLEHYRRVVRLNEDTAERLTQSKIDALSTIESYCLAQIHELPFNKDAEAICRSTYAYHSASHFEQQALLRLFSNITDGLRTLDPSISSYFYRTQLNSTLSLQILDWLNSRDFEQFIESDCTRLDLLANACFNLTPGIFGSFTLTEIQIALSHWTNGDSISQIQEAIDNYRRQMASQTSQKKRQKPTISSIERLTMKAFAYHLEYFISCLVDANTTRITSNCEHDTDSLRTCQHRIKYGVSTLTEALFCEQVIDDRMIAKDLRDLLHRQCHVESGQLRFNFESSKSDLVLYASSLPFYCMSKIQSWIEDSSPIF